MPDKSTNSSGESKPTESSKVQLAAGDASFATGQIYGSAGGIGQP
jgi:hypothetical protein